MTSLDDFSEILKADEPLAKYTWMKVGGPAQYLAEPRSVEELQALVTLCHEQQIPVHLLGGGSNLLVRDDGVSGVVLKLDAPCFSEVSVEGTLVRAGGGALLSKLISESVRHSLEGLEVLAGIPGTVGGALHGNAGGRGGDIGQFVTSATVLTAKGEIFIRKEDELSFAYRKSSIDELVILEAEFQLREGDEADITQRMRKLWIMKRSTQPLSFQSAGCIFKNPRGLSAGALIEQSGMKGTRIGGAEISDRHANFIVTDDKATANDVLRLIDLIKARVADQFGVDLELEINIW
ncbi:MAG TPA: UDP-N-acetylmuramate dehydrogenase [Planctomycetaceae bacterium]|nr:UDP-N-acetylmuramate dehydrogenase [Planctomycetaceae bacterium]